MFAERKALDNAELLTKLQTELHTAITSHHADLIRQFDDVCGYAICAPPYFEHIFPAYQLTSALQDCSADSLGLATHFPPEWKSFGTTLFDDSFNSLVSQVSQRRCDNESLSADGVYNAILDVLVELERDGIFGARSTDRFVTMWDVGGDESMILSTSEKLNSADLHSSVLSAFGRTT